MNYVSYIKKRLSFSVYNQEGLDRASAMKYSSVLMERLLLSVFGMLGIGIVAVASASMDIALNYHNNSFHYVVRHIVYVVSGILLCLCVVKLPSKIWRNYSLCILGLSILGVILTFLPVIGKNVNGSSRWIGIAGFTLQPSEFLKISVLLAVSNYLSHSLEGRNTKKRRAILLQEKGKRLEFKFYTPIFFLLMFVDILLLLQPDFGSCVVITLLCCAMIYLSGLQYKYIVGLVLVGGLGVILLAFSAPYRVQRLVSFIQPWEHQFDSGYQLIQSLIAFGKGGFFGVGIGSSVQKLFYLPEAHTDFVLAVLGEEFGFIGIMLILFLSGMLVHTCFRIALLIRLNNMFGYFLVSAIGLLFAFQIFVNLGVNIGILPTKGLTMPFVSYGGSSIWMVLIALGMVIRLLLEFRKELSV